MTRLAPKPTPALYSAIIASTVAVLIADYYTPLGVAVWIVYIVPIVLTFFQWRPSVPLITAVVTTVLMSATFLTDKPGVSRDLALINRLLGVLTVWILAYGSYLAIQNKLSVRRHEWLQAGHSGLSTAMVGDQRLDTLGESVLRFLAEYLDAQVGAIFIEDHGGYRRFATYAVPADADVPERVAAGEGLLGQAISDRRTFVIRDVPAGYLTFGSGLGKGRPRELLISPVVEDKNVNGVVELGFLHPIGDLEVELLDRVSEPIAIAIRTAHFRTRLQELYEETQRQSEELQAQSEELRVSNEELEEQSRALKESQARLENQQAELEQTNAQLEEQTRRLEEQALELNRARIEVEAKAREVEQASRYKSDFLANMSHELRTPLNSSLILAKLLADNRDGNLSEEQVKYAQTILSAGNDLLTLINDILDLSKIEAGHMEVRPESIQISKLFEGLERTFQAMADQKSLDLRTSIAPDVPATIETDPQRLEQILRNLLSNALKFTDAGSVSLEASVVEGGRVAFAVRDTGIGIPEDQQAVVFEAFRQADGTTSRKYGGTGLGLSITRQLVGLLGGTLHLQSEAGRGSTFTAILPQVLVKTESPASPPPSATAEPAPRPTVTMPAPAPRSVADDRDTLIGGERLILVVEDDAAFARILLDLAHEFGFRCLIASTAEEGLALASRFTPSAVVLDVGLPDNSGLSVLDRLKQNGRTRHVPVHVVSASDYAQTALELGAMGYMLKPVKRDELVRAFEQLETKLTQKMRRVLVVEDDPTQLESLRLLLGTGGVETVGVRTAAECLDMLGSSTFDCMVLDLSLPDASGFALLDTLSREDRYSFPPVIVYTGRELRADEEQQLRRYSKSIIVKGAKSPERLLDEVTLFLHQVVAELPAEQQRMLKKVQARDAVLEGRRILIAEDDVRNVFALTSILEPKGAQVVITRNGREAVDALERSLREDAPIDLALMDVMMPEMDGLTAMREIRKRPEFKKLPMIALTAKAMRNDQEECLAAGANDYMAKPLDVEKLLSLVRVWLPR